MKMFTWWVLICLLGVSAFAEGNGEKLQIEGVWQTSVKSGYLPVVGAMKHGEPVIESQLRLRGPGGWYLNLWFAVPLDKGELVAPPPAKVSKPPEFSNQHLADTYELLNEVLKLAKTLDPPEVHPATPFEGEIDVLLGYKLQLGRVSLDTSLQWYDLGKIGDASDDRWSVQTVATYTNWKRTKPWIEVRRYAESGRNSPPGGWYVFGGVSHNLKLFDREDGSEQALNLEVSTAWSDGKVLAIDPGFVYARVKVGADIKLRKKVFLSPSVLYQYRLADGAFAEKSDVVYGLGLKVEF